MKDQLISVIIPCYNQAHYLPETLDSVLSQNYQNWECVMVNDGSTDETESVAKKYCQLDKRFKYVCQVNKGLAAARNTGIHASKGEIIYPLDSDDKIHPEYFSVAINLFQQNPELGIIYCEAEFFGEKKGRWELLDYTPDNILMQSVIYASGFFKREDYNKTRGYDPGMIYGWEDWDFWLSLIELGVKVHKIKETYFYYRYFSKSMTRKMTDQQRRYLYKRIYLNHHTLYDEIFRDPFQLYGEKEYYRKSLEYKLGYFLLYPFNKIKKMLNQ